MHGVDPALPVADIRGFITDPYSAAGLAFVDDLRTAAHLNGALYLEGHGVDEQLVAQMIERSRAIVSPEEITPLTTLWAAEMARVARWLIRGLALTLGQTIDRFDSFVSPEPDIVVAAVRATAETKRVRARQNTGIRQDRDLFTLTHHDEWGGLQVRLGDRAVEVPPRPGACVVQIGTVMQTISRFYFPATRYRVAGQHAGRECTIVTCRVNARGGARIEPVDLPEPLLRKAAGLDGPQA
jgi:isopenicillin N synthase-like dioxygenase